MTPLLESLAPAFSPAQAWAFGLLGVALLFLILGWPRRER